jgi:hypothetical protein
MPDYDDAAKRHWDDATFLLNAERMPNADQLFGLSAECALKTVMVALGMPMNSSKPTSQKHSVHIDKLWDEFITFSESRKGEKYSNILSSINPFADWRVDQRYENTNIVTEKMVADHQIGAQQARRCLTAANMDGSVL